MYQILVQHLWLAQEIGRAQLGDAWLEALRERLKEYPIPDQHRATNTPSATTERDQLWDAISVVDRFIGRLGWHWYMSKSTSSAWPSAMAFRRRSLLDSLPWAELVPYDFDAEGLIEALREKELSR